MFFVKILSTLGLLSILSGCHLGQPQLFEPGPIRYQQSRAILHDPYPDVDAGPDVVGARQFSIGTMCGRYWAMDRDQRWERVTRAYLSMPEATGTPALDVQAALAAAYAAGNSDEFMAPAVIAAYPGMVDGDA